MSKTFKIEVNGDVARAILSEYEKQISIKIRQRDELAVEISKLEDDAKKLRANLQDDSAPINRQPTGKNLERITVFLKGVPDNKGAKLKEIVASTGISLSSANFTLTKNPGVFVKQEKFWKLK